MPKTFEPFDFIEKLLHIGLANEKVTLPIQSLLDDLPGGKNYISYLRALRKP